MEFKKNIDLSDQSIISKSSLLHNELRIQKLFKKSLSKSILNHAHISLRSAHQSMQMAKQNQQKYDPI